MELWEEIFSIAEVLLAESSVSVPTLVAFCRAAEEELRSKLKKNISPENCKNSFCCAGALMAVSSYCAASAAGDPTDFKAGDVSVTTGDQDKAAACLRLQAEMLMAPYCRSGFSFLGVRA